MMTAIAPTSVAFARTVAPMSQTRLCKSGVTLLGARRNRLASTIVSVAAPMNMPATSEAIPQFEGGRRLANPPPFTLQDLRDGIPKECFEKDTAKSFSYLVKDLAIVFGMAYAAYTISNPLLWPLYWAAQGTMFWALFVLGHDCGHQSFSNNKQLNDFVGNIIHSSIMVPYHGWRISHRTHHANHGHVENDESWTPTAETTFKGMDIWSRMGRLLFPFPLFAYPFYLLNRAPGKQGSHYDPESDLFAPSEAPLIKTSNAFQAAWFVVLAACTFALGPLTMVNLYLLPYWVFVMWLDVDTYLHHHGPSDADEEVPWYRGEEWNYMRGGLSTIDRDYGMFNKIQHDIGIHVIHHLFPQIPHYNLVKATDALKPVMGDYYREPEASPGPLPTHLIAPLVRSFGKDHYVADEGNIVFYQKSPEIEWKKVFFGKKEAQQA